MSYTVSYKIAMAAGIAAVATVVSAGLTFVFAEADEAPGPRKAAQALPEVSYTRDVAVLFNTYCVGCHADELHADVEQESDFDITSPLGIMAGGEKAGPAVISGRPEDSPLVQYVRGLKEPHMPQKEPPLSEENIQLLERWIAAGAVFDDDTRVSQAVAQTSAASKDPFPPFQKGENRIGQYVRNRHSRMALVPAPADPPLSNAPVNNPIDNFVVKKLADAGLSIEYPLCSDNAFARRAYLDIIGAIPSREEAIAFLNDNDMDKRATLIDTLLGRNADYSSAWVPFWEEALCSNEKTVAVMGQRGNFQDWIYESFEANKPYDIFASELIDPFLPNHPGKYVIRRTPLDILQSAANTAQVFLGTQMKCASCHNHFANDEWSQTRFFGFAGFLAPKNLELVRCESPTGRYIPTQYAFNLPQKRLDAPQGIKKRAARFAELLVDPTNPRFAKTIVNRLWKRYIGIGFFEPADDFRENRPVSHPELLDWLAYDLMSHDFDLKHTIRLILNSRTYQHEHNPALVDAVDLNDLSNKFFFRSPLRRRLTAEQVADSLGIALGIPWRGEFRAFRKESVSPFMHALGRPLSRNSVLTSRSQSLAVMQGLELINSEEYYEKLYRSPVTGVLAKNLRAPGAQSAAIQDMYWRSLGRLPKDEEIELAKSYVANSPADVTEEQIAGDLLWVLFTSPEFQYIQ